MPAGHQALTEKEKETLRLIVRGHDAKSMARHLGLSVHTVNERLRDARRKLQVSSSREAARMLLDTESEAPQRPADKQIGEAAGAAAVAEREAPARGTGRAPGVASPLPWLIAGVALMSVLVAILALAAAPQSAGAPASAQAQAPSAAAPVAETEAVRAARDWLRLHDEGRWRETWELTTAQFRKQNTAARWAEVAGAVRPPLGATLSRVAISADSVPAPPAGVEVVKFRTRFANKADAVETVSLAREEGQWRVVGIYID
jgi:DNA-binding CsgD family transcriptional regulator